MGRRGWRVSASQKLICHKHVAPSHTFAHWQTIYWHVRNPGVYCPLCGTMTRGCKMPVRWHVRLLLQLHNGNCTRGVWVNCKDCAVWGKGVHGCSPVVVDVVGVHLQYKCSSSAHDQLIPCSAEQHVEGWRVRYRGWCCCNRWWCWTNILATVISCRLFYARCCHSLHSVLGKHRQGTHKCPHMGWCCQQLAGPQSSMVLTEFARRIHCPC